MKKLLVLTLVLGITSLATAGLSLVQQDAKTATFNVDPAESANNYLVLPGTVGYTMELTANAGGLSEIQAPIDFTGFDWSFVIIASSVDQATLAGAQVLVTLTGAEEFGVGAQALELYDSSGYVLEDSLALGIPEPATMALLGLGALLLRRKK